MKDDFQGIDNTKTYLVTGAAGFYYLLIETAVERGLYCYWIRQSEQLL